MHTHTSNASLQPREGVSTAVKWSMAARAIDTLAVSNLASLVCVRDEDVGLRKSLERLSVAEMWEVETFVSANDFLSRPRGAIPCCLVLDLSRQGRSGLGLQRALAERTDLPIIFMTGRSDIPTSVQAMKAGAFDVLATPVQDDVLTTAISGALARSRAVLVQQSKIQPLLASYASLSPRERDVMALVVKGLLNKQAACELGISEITVKVHRGQVMRKMKAESLPDLVRMAAELGVLSSATVSHHSADRRSGRLGVRRHTRSVWSHAPANGIAVSAHV